MFEGAVRTGSLGMNRDGRGEDDVHEADRASRDAPILERPSMVLSEGGPKADEDIGSEAATIEEGSVVV